MEITKNQHYIPQLLLRGFGDSSHGTYRTNLFDITRLKTRLNQNVKNICSETYFYDKDNEIEKFLSKNIETPAANLIKKIRVQPTLEKALADPVLLRFIAAQLARTPKAYEEALAAVNGWMGTVFREIAKLNGLNENDVKSLRIEPTDPRSIIAEITIEGVLSYPLFEDLSVHVLINETSQEFILADHPVFKYNWYLRDCQALEASSIAVHGLQIFLPLSSKITLCLYDKSIYKYGDKAYNFTTITESKDIDLLNAFQALNANAFLVFRSSTMAASTELLGKKFAGEYTYTTHGMNTTPAYDQDGRLRSSHAVQRRQIAVHQMPSFIKVKSKVRKQPVTCQERRPGLLAAYIDQRNERLSLRISNSFGESKSNPNTSMGSK